ncbi:MAG: hypothetical protein SFW66_09595 [Gammaproteobacteria bacterium]|nr:hypothetical protein [Gammaproteobacteria bacterium]
MASHSKRAKKNFSVNVEQRNKIKKALNNAFALEASQAKLDFLKTLNISDAVRAEWIESLDKKYKTEINVFLD